MGGRPRPREHGWPGRWLIALVIAVALVGGSSAVEAGPASPAFTITVFAAASLTEAFTLLGKVFEERAPGWRVTFNFAGSQQLALQIEHGAPADVFASADQRWMTYLQQRGRIAGAAPEFARNRLVIIVPRANPAKIGQLQDLARPGVKFVIEADAVPAGRYMREALAKLARAPGFGPDFAQRVMQNVVSEEDNVKTVVAKVQLGEADAGAVYRSDVTPTVSDKVVILDIPDPYNVIASYPFAVVKGSNGNGQLFMGLVLSPLGQQFLRGFNFIPAAQP
jgi:molybdate transport system substrate-binding protein